MATAATPIDTAALAEALAHAEMMAEHYGKSAGKRATVEAQNIVLIANNLPPIPDTAVADWDARELAKFQRMADALQAVLAMLVTDEAEAA